MKWARLEGDDTPITLNEFTQPADLAGGAPYTFLATQRFVLLGNGADTWSVSLEDVFHLDIPQPPTLHRFYLPQAGYYPKPGDEETEPYPRWDYVTEGDQMRRFRVRLQLASTDKDDVVRVVSSPSAEAFRPGVLLGIPIDTDGKTVMRFFIESPFSTEAEHIDIYRTIQGLEGPYYWTGRVPYIDEGSFDHQFDTVDRSRTLIFPEGEPRWSLIESDGFRTYAMESGDGRLYLSYYDGSAFRLRRNFTGYIELDLEGYPVTGLKLLTQQLLAVYSSQKIILVQTDPLEELHAVIGGVPARDDDESVGCVAPHSLVNIQGYHYFLAPNARIYRFGGRYPTWQSEKVQPILDAIPKPMLSQAIATGYQGNYLLSYASVEGSPNDTTLIYDVDRDRWYKDGFGVSSFSTGVDNRLYGVVDGKLRALYEGADDAGRPIRCIWKSNKLRVPPQITVRSVFVKTQSDAAVDVDVVTESGSQSQYLQIEDKDDYYGQRAGFNLKGREWQIEVDTDSDTVIDTISLNERVSR